MLKQLDIRVGHDGSDLSSSSSRQKKKRKILSKSLTLYKSNSEWIIVLNIKCKTIKLLGEKCKRKISRI